MRPLQVWLPTFEGSINLPYVNRDARRAFDYWKDEVVVWLLPELRHHVRWKQDGLHCLAIPAEHFDRIDIGHIDSEGRLYAPTASWLPKTVDGLLPAWLNCGRREQVQLIPPIKERWVLTPSFDSDPPRWVKRRVRFGPGPLMPLDSFEPSENQAVLAWPPEGSPLPISPQAESAERFPLKIAEDSPDEAITSDGKRAIRVFLNWPKPLDGLMPILSGVDDLLAQQAMELLAQRADEDRSTALIKGQRAADPWIFSGDSTLELSWLRTAQLAGVDNVVFTAEDKGLFIPPALRDERRDESLLEKLLGTEEWQRVLARREPIQRVWGPVGLFWSLLLDATREGADFVSCERCGRLISGKRGKRFCSPTDGSDCVRARRAAYKRKSRDKYGVGLR